MKRKVSSISSTVVLFLLVFTIHGCQTLKEIANLRNVDFALGAVNNLVLAGVNLDGVKSFRDVSAGNMVKSNPGMTWINV